MASEIDWNITPHEAMLIAENERLKAENAYLRRAVNFGKDLTFTPIGVIDEMIVHQQQSVITLPVVASIEGSLSRYGNYHVLARLENARAQGEHLIVQYHAPGDDIKGKANYYVNELFPFLHKRFIAALANAIYKPRQEVTINGQ